jgi:hypothetical protein
VTIAGGLAVVSVDVELAEAVESGVERDGHG